MTGAETLMQHRAAPIRCAECSRPWLDATERWQGEIIVGDESNEEALETAVFCPECAELEFDGCIAEDR